MKTQFVSRASRFAVASIMAAVLAHSAYGQTANSPVQPTTAQRQTMSERHKKLADMHTKMAACLASEAPFATCRQEMIDSCSNNFGGSCPMMGPGRGKRGGRGKGMFNGGYMDWMMSPGSDTSTPAATPSKGK